MEKELEEWLKLHNFHRYSDYLTKDLANYINVSPRTIQRWIKDKTKPSKEQLTLIGKYLAHEASETPPKIL
ncbi:MAG: helix-turn-helix transcriptional regulator [Candidatus Omnitrophota bacterium]